MNAKLTRASNNPSEGRSLWVLDVIYSQRETLEAINGVFNTDFKSKENFIIRVKIGNTIYSFNGHCNIMRGDFFIGVKEWRRICNIDFDTSSFLKCEIISVEKV